MLNFVNQIIVKHKENNEINIWKNCFRVDVRKPGPLSLAAPPPE
jgi:hypothetical protein